MQENIASGRDDRHEVGRTEGYITLRVGRTNEAWKHYNLLEAPLLLTQQGEQGIFYIPSTYKLIWREQGVKTQNVLMPKLKGEREAQVSLDGRVVDAHADLVAILSREYELYPNEELVKTMDTWTQENGYKRYADARYTFTSRGGNAVFLTYLPRDESVGSYYIVPGRKDEVQLGFVARNSIDGSVGFGLDVFTFRGLCYNGSIVMNEIGSRAWNPYEVSQNASAKLKHRHTKGLMEIIENLSGQIEQLRGVGEQVIAYYRHLATVRLNQQIAEHLAGTMIPQKYFEQTGIAFEKQEGKKAKPVVEKSKSKDMWTVYNDLTAAIWHQTTTDMRSKFQYFNTLHATLVRAVPMLQAQPQPRRA